MKTFVYDAIKSRLVKRLKINADTATVLDDSAFTNLLDVISEGLAETARYGEYLYLEKKWDTAKNISSLLSMGALIGAKRKRPESATGVVIVSHTDEEGNERLSNYGKYFFDLNESSDYDELKKDTTAGYIKKRALVPWTNSSLYVIPEGTEFTSSSGISFFSTKSVKIRQLDKKYSDISSNSENLNNFLLKGGWDGIKYLRVPIIQGQRRTGNVGTSTGERNQSFKFEAENIEAANNSISKKYFYIVVTEKDGTTSTWYEIPMLQLAGPYDRVFETELSADGSFIMIKFGNGYSGRIPNNGAKIELHYIETAGKNGNIDQKFQINTIKFPAGYNVIDPRTKTEKEFLSCLNISPVLGGKNIETRDEFRRDAPSEYLKYYATSIKSNYEKKIYENSPYSLLNAKCFISSDFINEQIDNSIDNNIDEEILNQMSLISNSLNITAIKSNGQKMNDIESEYFINTLSEALSEIKGPNDALSYCEPKMIKMAVSVLIKTSDLLITDEKVKDSISKVIQSEYSIFKTDFKNEFISSRIIHLCSLFNFTDSVELHLDCLADISVDKSKLVEYNGTPLIVIPFNFYNIFSNDKFKKGFKNFREGKKFCLRVDLKVKPGVDNSIERTLLLVDSRSSENDSINEAKLLQIDKSGLEISGTPIISNDLNETFYIFDETNENYKNRQVRIGQFPILTNNVLSNKFIDTLFDFKSSPSEIRPFEQDNNGENKVLLTKNVETDLRKAITGETPGTYCYKKNTQFIENIDIVYYENFNDMNNYAYGYLMLPCSYFNFGNPIYEYDSSGTTGNIQAINNDYLNDIKRIINDFMDIKIKAEPRADVITPLNWNEIVYVDDDDITVEKETILKE